MVTLDRLVAAHRKDQTAGNPRFDHIEGFYDVDPGEVHPLHAAAKPSREALQQSVTAPVIVTPNPMVDGQVCS